MILPKNSDEFISELFQSIDLTSKIGDLRLQQFSTICKKVSGEIILEAVLKIMTKSKRIDKYAIQKESCKILRQTNPKIEIDLTKTLKTSLEFWNKSVPDFLFWLRENNGIENIKNSILELEKMELNAIERDNLKTVKWWLKIETDK